MKKFARLAGLVAGIALAPLPAFAAQFEYVGPNGTWVDVQSPDPNLPCTHRLTGAITKGDAGKIAATVPTEIVWTGDGKRQQNLICLDSPGGSFAEAVRIAELVKERLIGTRIEAGARCESACALVFMAGSFHAHESGTYRWRILDPLGRLGFHAPSLTIEGGNYNADTVKKAYGVALETVSSTIFQLIQSSDHEDGHAMKVSLLGEMLRTPSESMFYIETVDQAGRWDIEIGPLPAKVIASKAAMVRACLNAQSWQRDSYSSFEGKPLDVSNYLNDYSFSRKTDENNQLQIQITTEEMSGDGCTFSIEPGSEIGEYPSLRHTYAGFQALQAIAFLDPTMPIAALVNPAALDTSR